MIQKWLVRLSNDSPELKDFDPDRYKFENDKKKHDNFFASWGYKILVVDITRTESYKAKNREIYYIGRKFFLQYQVFKISSNDLSNDTDSTPVMREIYDKVVMGLMCIKDVVQKIGHQFYVKPQAMCLQKLFELMGFNVLVKDRVCEGGIFLKSELPDNERFLIVSYGLIEPFKEFGIPLLQCPPNIGMDAKDTHIDTLFGIINFQDKVEIDCSNYNGILYVHTDTLKKIQVDQTSEKVWKDLKNEMKTRGYLIRIYVPESDFQNIGINFKFDHENKILLTNAFPKKERQFLEQLGISVCAPEFSFGTNDPLSGGVNCSYLVIPDNESIQKNIISWIKNNTDTPFCGN